MVRGLSPVGVVMDLAGGGEGYLGEGVIWDGCGWFSGCGGERRDRLGVTLCPSRGRYSVTVGLNLEDGCI